MQRFTIPKPNLDDWTIHWDELQRYDWVRAWKDCPQDPIHHAEGNVHIHLGMVLNKMVTDPAWRALPEYERAVSYVAAILHDVAKPLTTKVDDPEPGRVSARGHSPKGATMARHILWEMEYPIRFREMVCGMILHHQVPYYLINEDNAERRLARISYSCHCDLLKVLADADIKGRICQDLEGILEKIELFAMYADELDCLDKPVQFADDHSRFYYFNGTGPRSIHDVVYDDSWGEVILMSGFPGSGKSRWIADNAPDLPVVSMDALRHARGIKHDDKVGQGQIRQDALEQARVYLRAKQPFIWDATNLDRQRRSPLIKLFTDYGARTRIVYVEPMTMDDLFRQNKDREHPIPEDALHSLIRGRWEVPTLMEAHRVTLVVNGVEEEAQNLFLR